MCDRPRPGCKTPRSRLVPSSLEPLALDAVWGTLVRGFSPTGYKLCGVRRMREAQPWMRSHREECKNATDMTSAMVTWIETFLKPCAYGARKRAAGLDHVSIQVPRPSCHQCRIGRPKRKPLTSHASYKPAGDAAGGQARISRPRCSRRDRPPIRSSYEPSTDWPDSI